MPYLEVRLPWGEHDPVRVYAPDTLTLVEPLEGGGLQRFTATLDREGHVWIEVERWTK